jgi:DNA end-binding protein Ku
MYYADEITLPDEVPKPAVSQAEKKMAKSLVENLAGEWTPEKYHDQYRNKLLDLLSRKAEGEPLPQPEKPGEVVDLMEALRQSVKATQRKRVRAKPSRKSSSTAARSRSTRKAG